MSIVNDFVGRVVDPFRGASPSPKLPAVHGGGFQSENPAVAGWLEKNPEVSEALGRVQSAAATLEGANEGALGTFNKAREKFDEAKANESRAHYDAREGGHAIDPELAKRLLRARQSASAASEEAAARATVASNNYAATRDALNAAVRFVGHLAGERSGVVVAEPVKLPSASAPNAVAADRVRHPMSDLANVERDLDEIEARANGEGEPVTVESLDAQAIWKNYRQNKGTPVSKHRLK